jgi:hypothetical protein
MNKILANFKHAVPSTNTQMEQLKEVVSTISDSLIKFYEHTNGGLLADEWIIENPNNEKWKDSLHNASKLYGHRTIFFY